MLRVLISGVSFRQRSLSQRQESDVLSYSERKIAKNFQGFAPGPHWEELTASPQTPRQHNGFSPRYACRKPAPPKNCWIRHWQVKFMQPSVPSRSFQWPHVDDICWAPNDHILCKIDIPITSFGIFFSILVHDRKFIEEQVLFVKQ